MRIAQYELIEELGRGGFGVVYKARDTRMGREVALKVIAGNFAQEPDSIERFRQEAQIAASLRHPRIVPVYDFGDADGTLYLAMALITGRTLRQLLDAQARKRLTLDQALPILAQLADALDYLAGQGLVHRDVKPANVLIEREDRDLGVTLTDFGLVRSLESSKHLTKTASVLGTPAYMAPEQAAPEKWGEVTPLTDVYALGIVTYEMLVGQPPFAGELATVLHAQAYDAPTPPLELAPDLGADLAQALMRGLAKLPGERYPNASALVTALRQAAESRARQHVQQQELGQLLEKAQAARQASDWLALQDLCVKVMQLDRTYPDALTMMLEASEGLRREGTEEAARRERGRRYEEGERALAAGQWQAAIAAFEEVAAGNPDFKDVQANLAQARDELQRAQWYDEAIVHTEAKRWAEACHTWINILRGRMDYHNGDAASRLLDAIEGVLGRLSEAVEAFQQQKHELEQAREALVLYDALATAVEAQDWEQTVTLGDQLLGMASDLKQPALWLTRARDERSRQGTLIRCRSCGSPIPLGVRFCPSCGIRSNPAPVSAPPPSTGRQRSGHCAQCGALYHEGALFCHDCGAPLPMPKA
jgi:predicted Ser/Thr protein kinase/tetratricopeptide (TPR) repeat protein